MPSLIDRIRVSAAKPENSHLAAALDHLMREISSYRTSPNAAGDRQAFLAFASAYGRAAYGVIDGRPVRQVDATAARVALDVAKWRRIRDLANAMLVLEAEHEDLATGAHHTVTTAWNRATRVARDADRNLTEVETEIERAQRFELVEEAIKAVCGEGQPWDDRVSRFFDEITVTVEEEIDDPDDELIRTRRRNAKWTELERTHAALALGRAPAHLQMEAHDRISKATKSSGIDVMAALAAPKLHERIVNALARSDDDIVHAALAADTADRLATFLLSHLTEVNYAIDEPRIRRESLVKIHAELGPLMSNLRTLARPALERVDLLREQHRRELPRQQSMRDWNKIAGIVGGALGVALAIGIIILLMIVLGSLRH